MVEGSHVAPTLARVLAKSFPPKKKQKKKYSSPDLPEPNKNQKHQNE